MWGRGVLPATLPAPFSATLSPALSVYLRECGAAGSASGQTARPVDLALRQSRSRRGNASPLHPGCPSPPLLPVWMNVYFLFPWCRTSLWFDFPSVLVVRGGAVYPPTPPSWFSMVFFIVVRVQLSPFSPDHSPPPQPSPTSHPQSYLPLAFSMCP